MWYFNYLKKKRPAHLLILSSVHNFVQFIPFCNILWMYPFDAQVIIQDFRSWELNAFSGFKPPRTYLRIFFLKRFIIIKGSCFCYSPGKGNWTFFCLSVENTVSEFVIVLQPRLLNNLLMHSCPHNPVQESSVFCPSLHCNSPLTHVPPTSPIPSPISATAAVL